MCKKQTLRSASIEKPPSRLRLRNHPNHRHRRHVRSLLMTPHNEVRRQQLRQRDVANVAETLPTGYIKANN